MDREEILKLSLESLKDAKEITIEDSGGKPLVVMSIYPKEHKKYGSIQQRFIKDLKKEIKNELMELRGQRRLKV